MAHNCPDCGQLCFCGGDIDDCCNDFEGDVLNCSHYLTEGCSDSDFQDEDPEPESEASPSWS